MEHGVDHIIVSSITLHQYLSIEGSKMFLSLQEVGFSATQILAFCDKLHTVKLQAVACLG